MDGCMGRAAVSHKPLRVLTWHVHANYVYYLTQVPHHYLLTRPGGAGHNRRSGTLFWGANAEERFKHRPLRRRLDVGVRNASN